MRPDDTPKTVVCEGCGKNAILIFTGMVKACYPALRCRAYKCLCGWMKGAPDYREETGEERFARAWREANP